MNHTANAANAAVTAFANPLLAADAEGCLVTHASHGEGLPPSFKLLATTAPHRAIIRIGGGCAGLSAAAAAAIVPYALEAFKGYEGVIFSGGTINVGENGETLNDMVTVIPGALAQVENCVALSTTPRTGATHATRDRAGFKVGGTHLNLAQQGVAVVQKNAADDADWDGDLPTYFNFMTDLVDQDFLAGAILMNGGEITRDEIVGALARGIPTILVEGSGRETDAYIAAFRNGDWSLTAREWADKQIKRGKDAAEIEAKRDAIIAKCQAAMAIIDRSLVDIVPLNDAAALRAVLIKRGFIA